MRPIHRALVGGAALLVLFATGAWADGLGRLKIALELHGSSDWTGTGGEWKKAKVDDSYSTEVVLKQGLPQNTNQWDPESGKRQMERVAASQQRAAELREQAARAAANRPGGAANRPAGPAGMDMAQMMAMREKVAACGTDNACKQKIAMQMMQGGGSGAPTPGANADVQAIMSMCQNEKKLAPGTKGFQECIETAGKQLEAARTPPGSANAAAAATSNGKLVEALGDDPDNDRYIPYWSHVDNWSCTFKGHTKILRTYEGAEADVQGLLKLSGGEKGEGDADPKQICNHSVVMLDTKTNTLWAAEFKVVGVPVTSTQKGGLLNGNTSTSVQSQFNASGYEATIDGKHYDSPMDWVFKTLSGGPLSGERVQEFTNTKSVSGISAGGKGTGKLTAKLTWSFTKE
jgi:hypothetical protein